MTGLRAWDRDPALPAAGGDRELRASSPEEVAHWVAEHLVTPDSPTLTSVAWVYARWKPGVSLTSAYQLDLTGGEPRTVVAKRYLDGKDREIAERWREEGSSGRGFRPYAHLADEHTLLWICEADRELPGISALRDARRLARWVEAERIAAPRAVRRRRTRWVPLRYKPERRYVARVELQLRGAEPSGRSAVARVHPPARLASILARRRALQAAGGALLAPALLGGDERLGFLFEEWLDVRVHEPGAFGHAFEAGRLLARLHGLPLGAGRPPEAAGELGDLAALFSVEDGLGVLATAVFPHVTAPATPVWTHGDFHPDQIAREDSDRYRLLDLDDVSSGDARQDLASWIADQLFEQPESSLDDASVALLEGYRQGGGASYEVDSLRAHVCRALVERAGASIRRLERGAVGRARRTLERALDLLDPSQGARAPLHVALARVSLHGGPRANLERVTVDRSGGISLALAEGEGLRWFSYDEDGLVERLPQTDGALPLSELATNCSVLSYRPGRRVVLGSPDGAAVIKGFRNGKSAACAKRHRIAERVALRGGLVPARLLSHDRRHSALRFERLTGRPPALDGSDVESFRALGSALRRFQSATAQGLEPFEVEDDLAVLEDWRRRALSALGVLPRGWPQVRAAVRSLSNSVRSSEHGLCHRDLHDAQVLITSTGPAVLDFDLLCRADVALDPANLLAHFELRAMQGLRSATASGVNASREALLDGLGRNSEPGFVERLTFYGASTFLRLALLYSLRPRWQHLSGELVRRAEGLVTSPRAV